MKALDYLKRTDEGGWLPGFERFNDGSPEVEVCELLHSLVRVTKPYQVLETGTYKGYSALFMALAMCHNGHGRITTLDIIPEHVEQAKKLWAEFDVQDHIHSMICPSLSYTTKYEFDMLFLDSEPDLRFDELVRFWPNLKPGGMIVIHDLHRGMGISHQVLHGMEHWPFGDFRPKLGHWLKSGELQVVNFTTPRGLTLLYKASPDDGVYQFLTNENSG